MKKAIVIISVLLSSLGLMSVFVSPFKYYGVFNYFSVFNFQNSELLRGYCNNFEIINFFFYLVFIVGIIVYLVSKHKETRLLRFVYSVILISKLAFVPIWIFNTYLGYKYRLMHSELNIGFGWIQWILNYSIQICIVVVSYRIIKYLNFNRELDFSEKVYGEHISKEYIVATKGQRFFNYLIDTLIWLIIYSSLFVDVKNLIYMYSQIDDSASGNGIFGHQGQFDSNSSMNRDVIAILYLLSFRFLYYLFFELIFKASPAKFLSETRVMDYAGEPTNFKESFIRTFCRNIPFNPITFLFGYNLHDNWSGTGVFQEKRIGVSGNKYLGYFFTIIGVIVVLYFGKAFYNKRQKENYKLQVYEQKIIDNKQAFSTLETGDVIRIFSSDHIRDKEYILRVSKIVGDKVYFHKIDVADISYQNDDTVLKNIDQYFSNEMEEFFVTKKDLLKAIIKAEERFELADYQESNTIGSKLLKDNENYVIADVYALGKPILKFDEIRSRDEDSKIKELSFSISNFGIPSKLIAIKSNQENVLWSAEHLALPARISNNKGAYMDDTVLILSGKGDDIKAADFNISVQDSIGKRYDYQIISNGPNSEVIIKSL